MPEPKTVRYEPAGLTTPCVWVGDQEMTPHISRFSVDHEEGQLPRLYLELKPGTMPEQLGFTGYVHVRETVHEDAADAALRFLEPIDAAEFERACMQAMELGGPATFGQAALEVLRGYASGGS
jgi:hypothetical protein